MASLLLLSAAVLTHGALPHIVVIVGDDVGHYSVGFTAGNPEAHTPNMDRLATEEGVRLTRHYVFKYCSPTRSSLMTGRLPLHVNQLLPSPEALGGGVDLRMTMIPKKLQAAGYATHHVGKWHLGGTFLENVPVKRGFNTSLGYLGGAEDHYTQEESGGVDLWSQLEPAYGQNGTYSGYLYTDRMVQVVQQHDQAQPLFLYAAFQDCHAPYQVPAQYENSTIDFQDRRTYQGMVQSMDESIGNLTAALKEAGMWDNTLVVYTSDNGGPSTVASCFSNNYPLRGSKHTDYEGGVRVGAFVSGGVLPKQMYGTQLDGYASIADWYATFAHLSGVDPTDHQDGVPDTDSLNLWPMLSGQNLTSPRTEIPLTVGVDDTSILTPRDVGEGLIVGPWKYILGNANMGIWMSPQYPNASTDCAHQVGPGCAEGCLFNIIDDPNEYTELSAAQPTVFAQMKARIAALRTGVFQTTLPPNFSNTSCVSLKEAIDTHKGFIAPRCKL